MLYTVSPHPPGLCLRRTADLWPFPLVAVYLRRCSETAQPLSHPRPDRQLLSPLTAVFFFLNPSPLPSGRDPPTLCIIHSLLWRWGGILILPISASRGECGLHLTQGNESTLIWMHIRASLWQIKFYHLILIFFIFIFLPQTGKVLAASKHGLCGICNNASF